MAVSFKDLQRGPEGLAAPAVVDAFAVSLRGWQQRVPEARRLTWRLRAPRGTDAALVRRVLLDGLSRLPDPSGWDACDAGFDVSATGSSPLFGEALAAAARHAQRTLVLHLPDAPLSSLEQDLQAPDAIVRLTDALTRHSASTVTIGTRWQRSREDARWAIEHALPVRLVPGAVADPRQPLLAPAAGLQCTLRLLAGRVPHVTVAWPEVGGALEALHLLRRAGTPCDLELVEGRPIGALRQLGRRLGVPLRIVCDWPWPERGPADGR